MAPPYTEPPERVVPLGKLLAAAGYGQEAAAQLDEVAAAEEVVNVFKDSRKVLHGHVFLIGKDPWAIPAPCEHLAKRTAYSLGVHALGLGGILGQSILIQGFSMTMRLPTSERRACE